MQKIEENEAVTVEEWHEKHTVTCMNMASTIRQMMRTFKKKLVSSAGERYRVYKMKLDGWVVVELEPESKLLKANQSMKNRLWVDVPDCDEE